ncbi:MAG: SBBP repeat-containing protein [Verrucomicrobia bacterium]|nr:SBBP repeat-containing protein [Verrucomicrobiota bacterium]
MFTLFRGVAALLGTVATCGLGARPAVPPQYGQLPLMFEPANSTGTGAPAFVSRGPGYHVRVSPARLDVMFRAGDPRGGIADLPEETRSRGAFRGPDRVAFGMELVGADPRAVAFAEDKLPTRVNYFLGNDPQGWRTGVTTHARIRYVGVYPGIDLVYYGNQRQLEHDFVVAPGVDPAQIRWRFEGIDGLELEPDGSVAVRVGSSALSFRPPQVYQVNHGERQMVPAAYRLESGAPAEVGFAVALYDPTRPLVIDPILAYSTFLGGLGYEQANGVAVDRSGQVYVVGETSSTNFPVTNALWPTNAGGYVGNQNPYGNEAFVAKLGAEGTNLVFATYLGGNGLDAAMAITLDLAGNPVITGLTASTNFPITLTAVQRQLAGEEYLGYYFNDLFVTKLSADGEALLYSTFIGGTDEDLGLAIALDDADAVYVAGHTESDDFPVRNSPYRFNGETDAFVLKFTPGETNLAYSMVLGGGGFDFAQGLAVDRLGHAYVVGDAGSVNFPVTNAFQSEFRGGSYDAFIAKVSPQGQELLFSTFLGGGGQDEALGVALDADANAYVTGYTGSSAFPVTNALYATKASGRDAFLAKFNAAGQLQYSSFLGGRSDDEGWAVAVDAAGSAHVAGMTQSSDFPLTNGLQAVYQGNRDLFIAKFRPDGQGLSYSSFLGGARSDEARSLALDPAGNAYVAGYTASTAFPVVPGASPLQRTYGGGVADAFVLKIVPEVMLAVGQPASGVIVFSWPAGLTQYVLESTATLQSSNHWAQVSAVPSVSNGLLSVTVTNLAGHEFYRLRRTD